jgi:hypothetical protein
MRLGDRILMEAPLRLHRRNCPRDYLIAVVDANDGVDLPYTVRRHFDEIWWMENAGGMKWNGSPRSALARRLDEALVSARVDLFQHAQWQPRQLPRSRAYAVQGYSCFALCRRLGQANVWPRYVVPRRERRWAREFLGSLIPDDYDALIAVHVRDVPSMDFKNSDVRLIRRILRYLRTQGRFAFLLIGREDGAQTIASHDVFSANGRVWHFDRTAALIAQASLFVGGDSGPTHAAAALGVPVIGIGYPSERMHPFTCPSRYVRFVLGERPHTIMAGVGRFIERLRPSLGRERGSW